MYINVVRCSLWFLIVLPLDSTASVRPLVAVSCHGHLIMFAERGRRGPSTILRLISVKQL